jgi:presequence protease
MNSNFLKSAGERYQDFVTTKCTKIDELNCFFREILHLPSGAQIIHIDNDDPENLFCLSFKTLPSSSNGAPHILEHTVLCGSKKFPVKDPFFSMTRRSLNTFMNALTGSDFTCYPASSQVEKDFYNLLEVYLDAVFHPQLKHASFLQEGYRLEFENPEDPNSSLEFKGVVFNEMKGALSSAESRLWHVIIEALCPELPYAYNSGGDPKVIPQLTYQELIQFYETHYHPSRCLFFFYGNFSLKNHLDFLAEKAFKNVLPITPLPPLQRQRRLSAPQKKELFYPISAEENADQRVIISFGWLTCPLIEQEDVLALSVLDSILMDTDASPLKHALLQSGYCTQAEAFIDTEMSEVPYVITCKGCQESQADRLQEALFSYLKDLSEKPISEHLIQAAIHQLEFSRMEISGDHAPFGLTLFFRSALAKQHGCDPVQALRVFSLFEDLVQKVKDPLYLPGKIKKYFVDNQHWVRVIAIPDPELAHKEDETESKVLETIRSNLSSKEVEQILKQTKELEEYQRQVETQNLDCLPQVGLKDVPLLTRDFPLKKENKGTVSFFHHDCFTNHILYSDFIFDLPCLKDEDLPYLQLLLSILPEIGSGKRDYVQNLEYMQAHTGGVGIAASLHIQATDHKILQPAIGIRGKALERKADKLFPFMYDMLSNPHLKDKKRIEELLKQLHTSLQNRVTKNALRYGIQLALSGFSTATHFNHACFGLRYFHFIHDICQNLEAKLPSVIEKLIDLKEKIFSFHNPHLVFACDQALYERILSQNLFDCSSLPSKPFSPWVNNFTLQAVSSQARTIASQVAYNVKAYNTVPYIHPHAPALTIATQLFDNKVLHSKIREKGGAYGSGANYSPLVGCFYFHSYRDPQIAYSFSAFDEAVDSIAEGKFNDQDLEEAKLGVIQQFDAPISPGSRAILAYGWLRDGKTKQIRQGFRDAILNLTKNEVKQAIAIELQPKKNEAVEVAFSNKDLIEKENVALAKRQKSLPIFAI